MANKKSTIIKDTIILLIITLVSGFTLSAVNKVTKEPIAFSRTEEKNKAYRGMFKEAESFEENEALVKKCEGSKEFLKDKGFNGTTVNEALIAKGKNETIGYIINATSPNGYGGNIQISLGLDKEGKIQGFEILSISETVGLGMKAKEEEFKSQFPGKKAKEIKYTKSGAANEDEINAISGATITTSAVTEAVNSALVFAEENILGKEAF